MSLALCRQLWLLATVQISAATPIVQTDRFNQVVAEVWSSTTHSWRNTTLSEGAASSMAGHVVSNSALNNRDDQPTALGVAFKLGSGGLGDRLVGLISVQLIAAKLGLQFFIDWREPDVSKYVTSRYFVEAAEAESCTRLDCIDRVTGIADYLKKSRATPRFKTHDVCADLSEKPGSDDSRGSRLGCIHCRPSPAKVQCTRLYINREVAQYLYGRSGFPQDDFWDDVLCMWESLYVDTIQTTPYTAAVVSELKRKIGTRPLIGVQIRAGDNWMVKGAPYEGGFKSLAEIVQVVERIKAHSAKTTSLRNAVFYVTSDAPNLTSVLTGTDYIIFDRPSSHIDKMGGDHTKTFVDNILLSEGASRLYISAYSNFGRIMALTSNAPTYNLKLELVDKRRMVSKADLLFEFSGDHHNTSSCPRSTTKLSASFSADRYKESLSVNESTKPIGAALQWWISAVLRVTLLLSIVAAVLRYNQHRSLRDCIGL